MCNKCKIGMSKKKKSHISGMGADMVPGLVASAAALSMTVATQEAKAYIMPMIYSDTDTAEQKATKNMYANIGGLAVGIGIAAASAYLPEKSVERNLVLGAGAGIAAQCVLSLWVNNVRAKDGVIPAVSGNWDAKAYQQFRANTLSGKTRQVSGVDNASPGLMGKRRVAGVDNASPGVMGTGVIPQPPKTRMEEIAGVYGIGNYNRVGSCGL